MLIIVGGIIGLVGWFLLFLVAGVKITFAVMLIMWSNNIFIKINHD